MPTLSTLTDRQRHLTTALLGIVADRGLDNVSVREVASAAGVSIGTVQHHFPSKDAMLAAAFEAVVEQIRSRVGAIRFGPDPRANLRAVLRELLPLDARRAGEVRVQVAFAARAAVAPPLARIQRDVLRDLHTGVTEAFTLAGHPAESARLRAQLAIAAADGLGLHAVSAPGSVSRTQTMAAVDLLLEALWGEE